MALIFSTTLPCHGDTLEIIRAKFVQAQTNPKKVYSAGVIVLSSTAPARGDTMEITWAKRLQKLHQSL